MSLPYERLVYEDLHVGYGTTSVTMPAGGSATGTKVGLHTWTGHQNPIEIDGVSELQEISEAILSAIGRVGSSGTLAHILLPPGQYYVGQKIEHVKSRVIICGAGGSGTELILRDGVDDSMFQIGDGSTYCTGNAIVGVFLRGSSGTQSAGHGIRIYGAERTRIEDVHIFSFKENGIRVEGEVARPDAYTTIVNSYINTNLGSGIRANTNAYGVRVQNNTIAGNGKDPVGGAGFQAINNDTHQIVGNLFDENEHGITLQAVSDAVICGNVIQNQDRSGVVCLGSPRIAITGNTFLNCSLEAADTYMGVHLPNGALYCTVTGNVFSGPGVRASDAVREESGADYNTIVGNTIVPGATLNGITKDGANTRVAENAGHATRTMGATSVADGGTVSHGLAAAPTRVNVTCSTADEYAAVTALGATTFTVALTKHDGTAGTTATVYWDASVY